MIQLTVKATKEDWHKVEFSLYLHGDEKVNFDCHTSRRLTETISESQRGIFSYGSSSKVEFRRGDTWVTVDFGSAWDIESYENPALEIKRRIELVEEAFEAVSEDYEKVWTVDIDSNREYVEKRKAEAAEASHYFDGLIRYEVDNCYEDADEFNEESFRVVSANGYDDTHLIAFCDIPQEAYFLKLTRID